MKLKKDTYKKLICLLMPVLLIIPALIINLHVFSHEHSKKEKNHFHDTTTFCDNEIPICKCSDFTFTFFSFVSTNYSKNLSNFMFKSIDIKSIDSIYFNCFTGHKKGRSPPLS